MRGNGGSQGGIKPQRINLPNYDSPDSGGSGGRRNQNNDTLVLMQMGPGKGGDPPDEDDDGPGNPGSPRPGSYNNIIINGYGGEDKRGREFQLVNLRNVNIVQFTGNSSIQAHTYLLTLPYVT